MEFYVKKGWRINPNRDIVDRIIKRCELNDGECPCKNEGKTHEDRLCPCKDYREKDVCHCSLYVKLEQE